MSKGPAALSTIALEPTEGDQRYYDAIHATVMESAGGRWFLAEYARRNRNADTELVLSAIDRIASLIQDERDQQAHPAIPGESSDLPERIFGSVPAQPQPGPSALLPAYVTSSAPSDLSALAERLQDIAWTMRERGFDSATCDEIESVASRIREACVTQRWAQELAIPADAPTPVEAAVPSAFDRPPTNEPEAFVGQEWVESVAVARLSEARFVTADIASLIRATAEPLCGPSPEPVAGIDDGDDAPGPAQAPAAEPPMKEEMAAASIMGAECSSPAAEGNPQIGALKVPPVLATSELTDLPALSFEEAVFTDGPPAIEEELEHVPALPALLSDIPHEDMLSGAWEESAAKPKMGSSVPAQSDIPSPTETSILNDAKLDIPDKPLDAVPAEHEETDSLLDLEQELFAPSPANPSPDMTPAQAPRGAEPTSAVAARDALAIQAGPAGPSEQTAVSGVPTSMQPAEVPSSPARPAAKSMPRAAPYDPLAALKALTDEERIALFT